MARESLQTAKQLRFLEPSFDDCPRICHATRKRRLDFCEGCEVARIDSEFRERCAQAFADLEGAEKYRLDSVLSDYYSVCSMEAAVAENSYRDDWTVLQCRLVDILRGERNRLRRIDDWNYQQQLKTKQSSY